MLVFLDRIRFLYHLVLGRPKTIHWSRLWNLVLGYYALSRSAFDGPRKGSSRVRVRNQSSRD
jgi:hypothetical protein